MDVRCQCGAVAFKTPTPAPINLYHCHCLDCQKQSSSAFGTSAIFPTDGLFPLSPELEGKLTLWSRPSNEGRTMDCYFCKECGGRVLHRLRDPDGTPRKTMSVKGGLVDGLDWSKAKHIYTRTAVVPIPPGVESYETIFPSEGAPPLAAKVSGK
ncbi:hypothetical protein GQ53DRAFT_747515 [Thozetella sp. PMI_491]|nr:hypothetical protein GQ53DRAFT_747515 [Thozetella sp. PMI_491]